MMNRPEPTPILKIDLTPSMYSHHNSLDPSILLQRIEFLELENLELKKREEYLKMINTTLLEALGNKDTLKGMMERLGEEEMTYRTEGNGERERKGKEVEKGEEGRKRGVTRHQENEEEMSEGEYFPRTDLNGFYESGRNCGRASSSKFLSKNKTQHQIQVQCNSSFRRFQPLTTSNYNSSKQKFFSKTKSPVFYQRTQYQSNSSTPKTFNTIFSNTQTQNQNQNTAPHPNIQARKSMMQTMVIDNSFSKSKNGGLSSSTHIKNSRGSENSYSVRRSGKSPSKRNIATALLCDLCGESFSPLEFMSHANECQSVYGDEDGDKSFDELESQSEDLLQTLQQQKAALLNQIQRLKKNRKNEDKNVQKNLDQIVLIINSKKGLNDRDIKNLLKEKNSYLNSSTARRR